MESIMLGIKFALLQGPHFLIIVLVIGFLMEAAYRLVRGALPKSHVTGPRVFDDA